MYVKTRSAVKGFTLYEVVFTTILIGILASFAIPRYTMSTERTRLGEGIQILEALHKTQNIYNFENNAYTNVLGNLDVSFPTAPKNFDNLAVDIPPNPLGSVRRIGALYTLTINVAGTITCADGAGNTGICQKMGCTGGVCN